MRETALHLQIVADRQVFFFLLQCALSAGQARNDPIVKPAQRLDDAVRPIAHDQNHYQPVKNELRPRVGATQLSLRQLLGISQSSSMTKPRTWTVPLSASALLTP